MHRIETLYVKFGDLCNSQCSYCCAKFDPNNVPENLPINPDIMGYVDKILAARLEYKKSFKNWSPKDIPPHLLTYLWGGEPLLYMEPIRRFVKMRQGRLMTFTIVSNGKLLNQELVDYINENEINYTLSHDGINCELTRGHNVLEDPEFVRCFNQIRFKSINQVLSAASQDVIANWEYFRSKVGDEVTFTTEYLLCSANLPSFLWDYDIEKFQRTMDEVLRIAADHYHPLHRYAMKFLCGKEKDVMGVSINGKVLSQSKFTCKQSLVCNNIDIAGNVYYCHNGGPIIGDIYEPQESIRAKAKKMFEDPPVPKACEDCEFCYFCNGQCPFTAEGEGKRRNCEMLRVLFTSIRKWFKQTIRR